MAKTSAVALPLKALLKKYASGTDDVTPGSAPAAATPANQPKATDFFPASTASEDNLYNQWKTGNPFSIAGALARDQVAPLQDAGSLAVQGVSRALGGLVNGFTGSAPAAAPGGAIRAAPAAPAATVASAAPPVSANDIYLNKLNALASLYGGASGLRAASVLGLVHPDAVLGTPQESAAMQQYKLLANGPANGPLTPVQQYYLRGYGQVSGGMNPYNLLPASQ